LTPIVSASADHGKFHTLADQPAEASWIVEYLPRKDTVLFLDVTLRKIPEMFNAFLLEQTTKRRRGQPESYSEAPARDEDLTIYVASHRTENILEFQFM